MSVAFVTTDLGIQRNTELLSVRNRKNDYDCTFCKNKFAHLKRNLAVATEKKVL